MQSIRNPQARFLDQFPGSPCGDETGLSHITPLSVSSTSVKSHEPYTLAVTHAAGYG